MTKNTLLIGLTLAAVTAAGLSAASFAQESPEVGGPGMGQMPAFNFETMDADKDGKVTEAEIAAHRAAEAKALDTNADGKLDQAELVAMHVKMMTERATGMAGKMIEKLDTDGDAALSAAELAARPMPARLFARIDADSDGAITKVEADAARDKMTERMGDRHGKHHGPRGFWNFGMGDN